VISVIGTIRQQRHLLKTISNFRTPYRSAIIAEYVLKAIPLVHLTMDSKSPIPSTSNSQSHSDHDPAPPSYSESISTPTYYPHLASQIRSQLSDLSATITALQTQTTLLNSAREDLILSLLTTQIQLFLSSFANSGLKKGTLILVPAAGLEDEKAVPTDYDFKNREEFDRMVRVRSKEDQGNRGDDEFSSGGSEEKDLWYWNDEPMALRLASYLNPPSPQKLNPPPPTPSPQASSSTSPPTPSRSFWSRKISNPLLNTTPKPPPPPIPPSDSKGKEKEPKGDTVTMKVVAEEVVFRTENDFGIFGTERGWGIVVRLGVVMDRNGGSGGG
jgi:hypothetical protein